MFRIFKTLPCIKKHMDLFISIVYIQGISQNTNENQTPRFRIESKYVKIIVPLKKR